MHCTAPTRFALAGDTLISVRAPVGDVNMALVDCAIGHGVAAARKKNGTRGYTYYFMRSLSNEFDRLDAEGTVYGSIRKKDFYAIKCVNPPIKTISAFESISIQIDGRIEVCDLECHSLAKIRNVILPKLIFGEIDIREAERVAETA